MAYRSAGRNRKGNSQKYHLLGVTSDTVDHHIKVDTTMVNPAAVPRGLPIESTHGELRQDGVKQIEVEETNLLGRGAGGVVCRATHKPTGRVATASAPSILSPNQYCHSQSGKEFFENQFEM